MTNEVNPKMHHATILMIAGDQGATYCGLTLNRAPRGWACVVTYRAI